MPDPSIGYYANEMSKRLLTMVLIIDDKCKILGVGSRTDLVIGVRPEDLVGTSILSILRPECSERFNDAMERIKVASAESVPLELDVMTSSGQVRCYNVLLFSVQGMNGELQFCFHGQDITEFKDSQWAIEMMNKKLNILGSATRHDVLNSLTGLFGYLELAEVKCKDENVLKFIKKAKSSAETVKKQMEFTRAYQELGSKKPDWIKVREIVRTSYAALNDPRLPLETDIDDLEVFADPMLEKVFYNIMDNAQRHSEAKSLQITFMKNEGRGELIISDDGKGVSENEKEFIFKRGYGRNSGFGLDLSREILDITGIKIIENGEEGKGARFVITIPEKKFKCDS